MSQQTEIEEKKNFIQCLKKSFYVDNCVASVDSRNEAIVFETVAKRIMAMGKFEMRGWEHTGQLEEPKLTSVLGLLWDKEQDTLKLSPTLLEL